MTTKEMDVLISEEEIAKRMGRGIYEADDMRKAAKTLCAQLS